MSRSSTTGLYTRVDNSFSNPVVGTTISPTDADTFFDDVESSMNSFIATSTTSVAIGTGAKTFTVAADIAGKAFLAGTFVHVWSRADVADFMFGSVTSYSTSTGALVLDVTATGGSGTNTDWNIMQAGARGAAGATGATGSTSGIKQAYSSTTTDADPGAGIFRLNHATPASATAAYHDNLDSGGATVSTLFDLFDDSGSTVKGFIRYEKSSDATVWAQFQITGTVVDGTGYRKLTLANGAGSGAFTNTDAFSITFFRTGDPGAIGGATGSTDNAGIRADGAGGATIQAALFGNDDSGNLYPLTSDTGALGTASLMWADLFMASGGVVNFNNGDVTITHSAGLLTFSDPVSLGTSNSFTAGTIELGAASDTTIARGSAGLITVEGVSVAMAGKQTIWIPASAMWARTTNGAAAVSRELTTGGDIMIKGWGFDTTTEEGVQFYIGPPKSWNKSTITFQPVWTNVNGLTTETVSWGLSVGAFTNDDPIDSTDLGTEVRVSDTWLAANDLHVAAESGAVTVGNTPIDGDMLIGQIVRSVANDNMTGDAELLGTWIYITTNAANDA